MTKLFLCSLLILSSALPILSLALPPISPVVKETCEKASKSDPNIKFDYCIKSMRMRPALDTLEFGKAVIENLESRVKSTKAFANYYLRWHNKLPQWFEVGLRGCATLYSEALLSTVKDAIEDYKVGDYLGTNVKVSAVLEAAYNCEGGFVNGDGSLDIRYEYFASQNDDVIHFSSLLRYVVTSTSEFQAQQDI